MLALTGPRQRAAVVTLIAFHIFIIIASNYLVQFPMQLFGWQTTWGAFSFPFIFLATDLTVRLLGKQPARRVKYKRHPKLQILQKIHSFPLVLDFFHFFEIIT